MRVFHKAAIGSIFLLQTALGIVQAKPADVTFNLLTYNIQIRPVLDRIDIKTKNISPLLSGFDVVGVQECFDQCERLVKAVALPNRVIYNTPKNDGRKIGSGLALMSKIRVLRTDAVHFRNNGGQVEKWASKGVLMMSLDLGSGRVVDVYTTHMQAGGGEEGNVVHRTQVDDILAFIKKNSPAEHSVVLMGDFNMRPFLKDMAGIPPEKFKRSAHYKALMEEGQLKDVSIELHGATKDNIDRVLFRAGKGQTLTPIGWADESKLFRDKRGLDMSDHPPIKAAFRLSGP